LVKTERDEIVEQKECHERSGDRHRQTQARRAWRKGAPARIRLPQQLDHLRGNLLHRDGLIRAPQRPPDLELPSEHIAPARGVERNRKCDLGSHLASARLKNSVSRLLRLAILMRIQAGWFHATTSRPRVCYTGPMLGKVTVATAACAAL